MPCVAGRLKQGGKPWAFVKAGALAFSALLAGNSLADDLSSPPLPEVAGSTAGEFQVTESGSATYTIPIDLPGGIAGLTPQLAMSYDSQGGNGHLGQGWALDGLSVISRCHTTYEQEGWIESEPTRFCLDGQKLILVEGYYYGSKGAVYRTEIDSFRKIVSYGNQQGYPTHFKVWNKDGSLSEYGNSSDSRVEGQGSRTPIAWTINKIQDNLQLDSNSILFNYNNDHEQGELALETIAYAGGRHTVKFGYVSHKG